MENLPPIVAIIGSSRFKREHLGVQQRETLLGKIVLTTGLLPPCGQRADQRPGQTETRPAE
jgi:hypothetical protein